MRVSLVFTGPRFGKRGYYEDHPVAVRAKLWQRSQIIRCQSNAEVTEGIVGGALDFDTWAAEELYRLGIPYVLAIPFEGYDGQWNPAQRVRGAIVRSRAREVVVVSEEPSKRAFHARNDWMLKRAQGSNGILIGQTFGNTGGSASTIRKARALNPRLAGYIVVNPLQLEEVSPNA